MTAGLLTRPAAAPVLIDEYEAQGWRVRRNERLNQVFEERCDQLRFAGRADQLAVDSDDMTLTFDELDARANQLARYLKLRGAKAGDRIALLFDRPAYSYLGMVAVLKINAAYVPLDVGFPTDRTAYIIDDAGVSLVLSLTTARDRVAGIDALGAEVVYLDLAAGSIDDQDPRRLSDAERGEPVGDLAYLIYTSGTTGRPKGVAIDHLSICNFVRVAAEVYGIRRQDRVYQGLTIAFDFSVEEIWVPWVSGATLVPKPAGASLLGADLHEFLTSRRVTAMCCVPTLLATLERDLPNLRFLLVSGEACPRDLITRWWRPDRRFLNVYGPTEATVTATWTELHPDKPVTIGVPLPTYSTVILDPQNPHRALPHGQTGEIGIAGIGLARGYLNRDDLTEQVFIDDFLGIPANPSGRIYRTGDVGRVNEDMEIEYLGRIDLQVKIRGYRIELTEIESVLLQVPGIAQAVVDTYKPNPDTTELVGYYSLRRDTAPVDEDQIYALLRQRLPAYMVPAYLQRLDIIPMTTSDKADRKALPPPTSRRRASSGEHVAASGETEQVLAEALASVLGVDEVSVESDFFTDLSANSLLMAQFSARVRKAGLPSMSMREIYQNPTVRQLATALVHAVPGGPPQAAEATGTVVRTSTPLYLMCGALQLLALLGFAYLGAFLLARGFVWSASATTPLGRAGRAGVYTVALFLVACVLPILAKWTLIGRWTPREIRLWTLGYFRFWFVKSLIQASPLVLFAGTPIHLLYLRALGAKIGRGTTILSPIVPVATDLISIGPDTIIRRGVSFTGYHAISGVLRTGPVTLGADAFVGEASVLDINTAMGDGAQLGHGSSLHPGQHIPAGERWHGVPAQPATTDYRTVERTPRGTLRRFVYTAAIMLVGLAAGAGLSGVVVVLLTATPRVGDYFHPERYSLASGTFYLSIAIISAILFFGGALLRLGVMVSLPRLLSVFVRPGRTYRLYGARYLIASAIIRLTNSRFFMMIFGDSSAAVGYTRGIGYDVSVVEQTGSNFGTEIRQDSALLTRVGTGTVLSDGVSIMNADFSSSSFRLSPIAIGERNFFGNNIAFPAGAKVGDNVLLATKVMVPIDGPVRENVGLLGSPPFEIPRSVARDSHFDHLKAPDVLRRRLAAKLRHNLGSMAFFLLFHWVQFFALVLLLTIAAGFYNRFGELAIAFGIAAGALLSIVLAALAERVVMGFHRLTPRFVSIYDPYFWRHERLWKVLAMPVFSGTPFKSLSWRLLGVRVGKRLFDDGCGIPEKTLVTIGDDVVLNAGSVIQCHSLEDGTFKSDYTVIGSGAVLGVSVFVHYGVTMGEGSVLAADAFLMKGEQPAPFTHWAGNPATEIQPSPVGTDPTDALPAASLASAPPDATRLAA